MAAVVEYVRANPGCTQQQAAIAVGPHGSHAYGVRAVKRALAAGLIVDRAPEGAKGYSLHVVES